jgi:hypothetical protein
LLAGSLSCSNGSPASEAEPAEKGTSPFARTQTCEDVDVESPEFALGFELRAPIDGGSEREICQLFSTGPEDVHLTSTEVGMSDGAHHGFLLLTSHDQMPTHDINGEELPDGPFSCERSPRSRIQTTKSLAGSMGKRNLWSPRGFLPDGVGIKIPANSIVVMNLHMLNTKPDPIDACLKVGVRGSDAIEHEAGSFALYNPYIAVPAFGRAEARMACPITDAVDLLTGVSHAHSQMVDYEAVLLDRSPLEPGAQQLRVLYKTTEWEDPEPELFQPSLKLQPGQWIDYRCSFSNRALFDVSQGMDTTDEMCMFIGVFYPNRQDMAECRMLDGDQHRFVGQVIGSGALSGAELVECVLGGPMDFSQCGRNECASPDDRYLTQRCFAQACPAAGEHLGEFGMCMAAGAFQCGSQCTEADDPVACRRSCIEAPEVCGTVIDSIKDVHCD